MTHSVTGVIFPRFTDSNPSRKPYTFCDLEFDSFGEAPNPTGEGVRTQAGASFKKNDVSVHEPGKPDQERNEECCAECCRRDAENQGVRSAFHHLVNGDSTGSASTRPGANGRSKVLPDFEFLKLSRERIPASGKPGCLCWI